MDIANNYARIIKNIENAAGRAGRNPTTIKIIAVTKMVGVEEIEQAGTLGIIDFAENRVQDALPKIAHFSHFRWHFIGHLQTNKVHKIFPFCTLVHSLDRLSLAKSLQKEAEKAGKRADVLIQVNISGEQSKHGLKPGDLADFLTLIENFDLIKVHGLMTIAPQIAEPEDSRLYFRELRDLRDKHKRPGMEMNELSMGMTNDYPVAIEEGATMIRIGAALFS